MSVSGKAEGSPDSPLVTRDDVRIRQCGQLVYVCRSDGAALRLRSPGGDGAGGNGAGPDQRQDHELSPSVLPAEAVESLRRRGLLVPADVPHRRHPSFPGSPPNGTGVRVVGADPLSRQIEAAIRGAGIATVPDAAAGTAAALVVDLTVPDETLTKVANEALTAATPVLIYAAAGARVYWAVLRPPATACPVCVSVRIRACRADSALGGLPLRVSLGTSPDLCWPSSAATAALLAHQAIRTITTSTDQDQTSPVELIELNLDTAATTRHPLLHTPFCPACHTRLPTHASVPEIDRNAEQRDDGLEVVSLARSWERMQPAVDPLTGIISGLAVVDPGDPDAAVDCTVAWAQGGTDTTWFSAVRASTVGGATKHDRLEAQVCAVGEILERYAAGIYQPEQFRRGSLTQLGSHAVDPRELPLGSAEEYARIGGALVPYQPDLVIDWVEGRSLRDGQPRYLPAAAVYVPYQAPGGRSERLLYPNSTGLAAGANVAHAIRGGLLEVIERDGAAIYWYNKLRTPTLDLSSLPDGSVRTILARISGRGVQLLAKDITTDIGIPTVMLLGRLVSETGSPIALCGFRAELDLYAALLGAAQELDHLLAMSARSLQHRGPHVPDPTAEPRDIWDFATYYCHRDRIGLLDFMGEGPIRPAPDKPSPSGTHADAVDQIVTRLVAAGYDPVAVDITPIDVAECGVSVVRTVVAGLQPVSFHRTFRHLGGRRVFQAPVRMGLSERPLLEDELNPDPIPLG